MEQYKPQLTGAPTANKALGQHYLSDANIIRKIAEHIAPKNGEFICEIGPGPGVLTKPLLASGADVNVVEMDGRFLPVLEDLAKQLEKSIAIHHTDALKFDFTQLNNGEKYHVTGNLPYNVGTHIVMHLLQTPQHFSKLTFMLQKEVIDRMLASPGCKDWGRLAIMCDLICDRERLFNVPPGAFSPPPKVMSAVIRLTPLPAPRFDVDLTKLDKLLRACFTQRRKMLRSSLKKVLNPDAFEKCSINQQDRPENLTTQQFCDLAKFVI